jgi:hypothetical protein
MAVDAQVPVGVRGEPVVLVAVEHDGRLVADPALAEELLEPLLLDEVALDGVLQVLLPVQLHRTGDVSVFVQIRVLVDLRHDDVLVVQVLRQPVRGDEHLLRVAVLAHPCSSLSLLK